MKNRNAQRLQRKLRIRAKVQGTGDRPRLAVFRSNTRLYVQVINDVKGTTILTSFIKGVNVANAKTLGLEIAQKVKKHHIGSVVFDRGGYKYHGVVKALADAVREGGIAV